MQAGPGAAQPCDPSCLTSTTSVHAPPSRPVRATHTGTAASPSRVCHHGVRGRSTVWQALGPDNRDLPAQLCQHQDVCRPWAWASGTGLDPNQANPPPPPPGATTPFL